MVRSLSIDNWIGDEDNGGTHLNPTWELILSELRRLNGEQHTLLSLNLSEDAYILVGGGESGYYIVTATLDNMTYYNLIDESQTDETIYLKAGGQFGDYSRKLCIDFNTMSNAVKTFAIHGKIDSSLSWLIE
ncbi:Imm1 family immunity protein [Paenibacillus glycanilyticus]|uniref:Imm1 family immunity protein n=1 Tax=Paenibacillus glycanilyticus TaxID=126569 RepID=UPI001910731D|nr:Imm1 family immunity protein [Paenibacillus glycanilyticus]